MQRTAANIAVLILLAGIMSLPSAAQVAGAVISGVVTDSQMAPQHKCHDPRSGLPWHPQTAVTRVGYVLGNARRGILL